MRIMNTKVRPCELLYRTGVDPDRGIIIPLDERKESRTTDEYIQKMADVEEKLFKLARDTLKRHDAKHLQDADDRPHLPYAVDSYVLLKPSDTPSRTQTPMEGPLQVVKHLGNSHYLLKDLVHKKERTVHVSRMKKYLFDNAFTSPQGVAERDTARDPVFMNWQPHK